MKIPVTFILCASLALAPFTASPSDSNPPPDNKQPMFLACVVLIVGAVVVYGLLKICQKIPTPPAPPPPPPPPPRPPGTNTNHIGKSAWVMPRLQIPDQQVDSMSQWTMLVARFESSEDLLHWSPCLYVTNWVSFSNVVCVAVDASGPVATNWLDGPWPTGEVICDFGNLAALIPAGERRFYRLVEIQ